MIVELKDLAPFVTIGLGAVNAWLIWLAGEGKRDRNMLKDDLTALDKKLAAFQIQVTEEYVRTASLRELEERLISAIDRLGDRLDRLFENRKQ